MLISYSSYTKMSHASTDSALGKIWDKLQQQSSMLQHCLEALRAKNNSVDDDHVSITLSSSQFFFLIRSSFVNPLNPPQQ